MTIRDTLADWISGGALRFERAGWARSRALHDDTRKLAINYRIALQEIRRATRDGKSGTAVKIHRMATEALE